MITVYTAPSCAQCFATKRHLRGIEFVERNVREDDEAATIVHDLGYQSLPVVTVDLPDGQDHWQGFRPDQLDAAIEVLS